MTTTAIAPRSQEIHAGVDETPAEDRRLRRWAQLQALTTLLTTIVERFDDEDLDSGALDGLSWEELRVVSGLADEHAADSDFERALFDRNPADDEPEIRAAWELADAFAGRIAALMLTSRVRDALAHRAATAVVAGYDARVERENS